MHGIRQESRVTAGDTTVIDRYGGTPINGNPRVRKLLEDNGQGVVYEYYQKTGFFHANHNVIVQNRILRDHPWVALELFNAFQRSKEVAYERARRAQSAYLYFPGKDAQEQAAVLGEDPYPIGLRAMGKNIARAIQGSVEQGLLTKPLGSRMCISKHTGDLVLRIARAAPFGAGGLVVLTTHMILQKGYGFH